MNDDRKPVPPPIAAANWRKASAGIGRAPRVRGRETNFG